MTSNAVAARGKLTLFVGYAPGVGKTYALLDSAHQRLSEGVDVVVGHLDTHGQAELELLVQGLESTPPRVGREGGATCYELDVEALLARRPSLVLVDDLALANSYDSRHPRRYLDVEELRDAGIDVYATLNIQQLASLADIVTRITGVAVAESVPDYLLETADEVELVDLPPQELVQRLQEGKIHLDALSAPRARDFYRPGNLFALRELALRRVAERVDEQMRGYMRSHEIAGPWPAAERLLVCVSPSPLSERLVRAAARMARTLKSEWLVLYIETTASDRLPEAARDRVARSLRLAEELGARVVTLPGRDVAASVIQYARAHNVTRIVAGKPAHRGWMERLRGSLVDQIIRLSGDIDVYVISGDQPASGVIGSYLLPHRPWWRYLQAMLLVILVSLVGQLTHPFLAPTNLVMVYLLAVVIAAVRLGRGPSILTSLLGVLAFDFFHVPPRFTFDVADAEYLLTFAGLLLVGLVISGLAARAREQAEAASQREAQTAALHALSGDLASAADLDAITRVLEQHVRQALDLKVVLWLPGDSWPELAPAGEGDAVSSEEKEIARWALTHRQPAGHGTGTFPAAPARYLPLEAGENALGVLEVRARVGEIALTRGQERLLAAFASQAALAVERAQLARRAHQLQLLDETEKLQSALLNSISHDLRTPLSSITGALSSLRHDDRLLDGETRLTLLDTALGEAERLNRLVGNLLDMSRMEAGAMRVVREPCDVQDLAGVALAQVGDRLAGREVVVDVPPGLPMVPVDFVLVAQVLANLLDNALKYSPEGTPLEIRALVKDAMVELSVADRGIGIPPEERERIFEKFYRLSPEEGQPAGASGTGLGLSIARGIVEAHGGRIRAEGRAGGGARVALTLPLSYP
jgi:two-component system sensor histidine kinase KdpD